MRAIFQMLRAERSERLFFLAHAQSSFGTGIGYVALVLIAYDRHPGAWGITLVLLADFVPAIALALLPVWTMPLETLALGFAVVAAIHLGVNVIGYAIGAREQPI